MKQIITVTGTVIFCFIGYIFANLFLPGTGVFDGQCGGWGIYKIGCYINQIIPISIFCLLPLIFFKHKKTVSITTIISFLVFYTLTYFGIVVTNFIFTFPPILNIWVGFYPVIIISIINLVLLKLYPKYANVGL